MSSVIRTRMCTNLINSAKLQFSTSSVQFKSHYDTLGITSKATHSEIKSAYYELSKVYHPDKNSSKDAKQKFRNITDAYETLGNYKLKKRYDQGMRPGPRQPGARDPKEMKTDDAQTRFYKSRLHRDRVPTATGRTPIYNFDEWAKAHYGELFNHSMRGRQNRKNAIETLERENLEAKNNLLWWPILVLFVITTTLVTSEMQADYDRNKLETGRKDSRPS